MPNRFYAHSGAKGDLSDGQPLEVHLKGVAASAGASASRFGAARAAALTGMLHDLGKYTQGFMRRLRGGEKVDHATAGAKAVLGIAEANPVMRSMIAYLIAGHHSGLPDLEGLHERLAKGIEEPDEVWREELDLRGSGLLPTMTGIPSALGFQMAFLGRMIFACLVDADRKDTAAFERSVRKVGEPEAWPELQDVLDVLISRTDAVMAKFGRERPIDVIRRSVLDHARGKAGSDPGLFTMTVPTGGGKTLASLCFALDHAKAKGLERVVYAIPFTSIIDQTAEVFERTLGPGIVLPHHSGFDFEGARNEEDFDRREESGNRLAMEDWAAPVVVTTNVQLFESLFSHRPSRCRKLQGLARSVIVLDEAQTIPLHVMRPCLAALNELVRNYGCSVVVCTATQPAVLAPRYRGGLAIGEADRTRRELAPDPSTLHRSLRRVRIRFGGVMDDDDLTRALRDEPQGLVIVNSRRHALELYRTAARELGAEGTVHMSTRQCGVDRKRALADVRRRLREGETCRVIATSLIEAGVDVDFPTGWRAEAGLDSIAQAAGRVNREGLRLAEGSILTVFEPADAKPPREIEGFVGDRQRAAMDPEDPLSPDSIERYFGEVYWRTGDGHDATPTPEGTIRILDADTFGVSGGECAFRYRTVGENFRLIRDGMASVIVVRDERARGIVDGLSRADARPGSVARDLQPFVVQIPPKARARLLASGHAAFAEPARFGDQFCVLVDERLYDPGVGLLWEDAGYLADENLIV